MQLTTAIMIITHLKIAQTQRLLLDQDIALWAKAQETLRKAYDQYRETFTHSHDFADDEVA